MSRNLGSTSCVQCPYDGPVELTESPLPVTCRTKLNPGGDIPNGIYKDYYEGMMVANAQCPKCEAQYLAWITYPGGYRFRIETDKSLPYLDLSFRSTFNDEPGEEDMARYEVTRTVIYERKKKCIWCRGTRYTQAGILCRNCGGTGLKD